MAYITKIIEPSRLYLVWQAPEGRSRARRVVGELINENAAVTFKYLTDTEDYTKALADGFDGYPAFNLKSAEHKNNVQEVFLRRLPAKSRSDFTKYLRKFGIRQDAEISDFSLLGYTEAKLPNDGFSIVNSYEDCREVCEFLTEIAGFRYYSGMDQEFFGEIIGKKVEFRPDDENEHDPNAVQIWCDERLIGYVNKIQAQSFRRWIDARCVQGSIDRANGDRRRPIVLVFVQVDCT